MKRLRKTAVPLLFLLSCTAALLVACSAAQMGMSDKAADDRPAARRIETHAPFGVYSPVDASSGHVGARVARGEPSQSELAHRYAVAHGALPAPDEEIWIIARDPGLPEAGRGDDPLPRAGALARIVDAKRERLLPLPLSDTMVDAHIDNATALVRVRQQFSNPFDRTIEAIYAFPVPHNAAVTGFTMEIGRRRIHGVIREREEAQRIYYAAREQGYRASLLTEDQPGLLTQRVAGIAPHQQVDVSLTYFHTVDSIDGQYEFVFPLTTTPHFDPARRHAHSPHPNRHESAKHNVMINVTLNAGPAVRNIHSPSHRIDVGNGSESRLIRVLEPPFDPEADPSDRGIATDRDFVLRYTVAGDATSAHMVIDERGRDLSDKVEHYFLLTLTPPHEPNPQSRRPLEMVFVVDTSKRMGGQPLELAKAAIRRAVAQLGPGDTVQIIWCAEEVSTLAPEPMDVDQAAVGRCINSLDTHRGSRLLQSLRTAVAQPRDPKRDRHIVVLSDGHVGEDRQVLQAVHSASATARFSAFGFGPSPNRFLLHRVAKFGQGAAAFITTGKDLEKGEAHAGRVIDRFMQRIAQPAMTDIRIDWADFAVEDVYPSRIPDLLAGRSVTIAGRLGGMRRHTHAVRSGAAKPVRVTGRMGGETVTLTVPITHITPRQEKGGVPVAWARMKMAALYDHSLLHGQTAAIRRQITDLGLSYALVSHCTAFLAVDPTRTPPAPEQ